jgi:hypothetical protein
MSGGNGQGLERPCRRIRYKDKLSYVKMPALGLVTKRQSRL